MPAPGLEVRDGKFFLEGRPYRGVGVNYYDLFTRLPANPGDSKSLEGLKRLAKAGVPFVRFNGGGYAPEDWLKYRSNKEVFFQQFDRVVRTAEKAGIGLIPSLFWNPNLPKVVGERKDAWGDPASQTIGLMREYVADVVGRYKDSPAIWAWELGNEWNLYADLPNAKNFRKEGEDERDDLTSRSMAVAITEFASAIRRLDLSRPIITGHSHPRASAWHNTSEKSWSPDSYEQWREVILRDNTGAVDTIGIHIYGDTKATETCGKWTGGWRDYLGRLRELADERKLPVVIGEFGLADGGNRTPEEVKERFQEILAAMESARIDMAAVWVYDLTGQNGAWNITFENGRSYMLAGVIEANRRWDDSGTTSRLSNP